MIAAAAYIKKILDTVSVKGIIVKGSLVFSYSRVWGVLCTLYIAQRASLSIYRQFHSSSSSSIS